MSFFDEFKKFAMRGNVVDLAVGVISSRISTDTHLQTSARQDPHSLKQPVLLTQCG